jgi:TPR repeat protein
MDGTSFWSAVGAIGTIAAAVIAYMAYRTQHQKEFSRSTAVPDDVARRQVPGDVVELYDKACRHFHSDPYLAMEYFRIAAERGHAPSQAKLGIFLRVGRGCVKNVEEGNKWLEAAAQQGDEDALKNISRERLFGDHGIG